MQIKCGLCRLKLQYRFYGKYLVCKILWKYHQGLCHISVPFLYVIYYLLYITTEVSYSFCHKAPPASKSPGHPGHPDTTTKYIIQFICLLTQYNTLTVMMRSCSLRPDAPTVPQPYHNPKFNMVTINLSYSHCQFAFYMFVSSFGQGVGYVTLGTGVRFPVTAITFSCAVIHFPTMYNLQHHLRPVNLIPCLYGVEG